MKYDKFHHITRTNTQSSKMIAILAFEQAAIVLIHRQVYKTCYILIIVLCKSNWKALLMKVKTSMRTKTPVCNKSEGGFRTKLKLVLQQEY